MAEFSIKVGDVMEEPSDLLLLKYAQASYGVDSAVKSRLISAGLSVEDDLRPSPGDFVVIETKGTIAPKRVMFLGTPHLQGFDYDEMEMFTCRAIEKIADLGLTVNILTTTIHGTGYGLDGGEALQRLIQGFWNGLSKPKPRAIERITFLTLEKREERMLSSVLRGIATTSDPIPEATRTDHLIPSETQLKKPPSKPPETENVSELAPVSPATTTVSKRHIFVALPFSEEFQNVYEFGIYPAVRNCDFICERVDETHFVGDVLSHIRGSIEAADLVIADLTEGRPNVYLEVGYAWGRSIPVIFVAKKGEELHFDVSTHKCIFYGNFTQFAKDLEELIRGIEVTQRH